LTLQFGQCLELSVLAHRIGLPSNPAAVAKAIRSNPISILVPSHRVLGWETATDMEGQEWLYRLRALEDITPGESTCLMASSLPSTMAEMARSVALSPPARFRSIQPRGIVARLDP
jgi:alkylated DNA nucleotide flippase Atl1